MTGLCPNNENTHHGMTKMKAGDVLTIGGPGITSTDGVWEFVLTSTQLVVRKVADHSQENGHYRWRRAG